MSAAQLWIFHQGGSRTAKAKLVRANSPFPLRFQLARQLKKAPRADRGGPCSVALGHIEGVAAMEIAGIGLYQICVSIAQHMLLGTA